MKFIIGGAYQGKKTFAKAKYDIQNEEIWICSRENPSVDWNRPCISNLEEFVFCCISNGENPLEEVKQHRDKLKNSILICRDIFCGVVPMNAQERKWREETGRLCSYLAEEADTVTRIYCGLEQKLK